VSSSFAAEGLLEAKPLDAGLTFAGLARGEGAVVLIATGFDGVGRLDSLSVGLCPGLGLGTVLLGEPEMVFGVTVLDLRSVGLARSEEGPSWFLPEYGPAVAGRGAISGRRLTGLIGATDIPPCDKFDGSARGRVAGAVAVDELDIVDEPDTDRTGDIEAIADPGRAGRVLLARAFFCANMASLSDGFELAPIVLFDSPKPGRGAGSAFLGEFGLLGSF
jgi:hypothetical protein